MREQIAFFLLCLLLLKIFKFNNKKDNFTCPKLEYKDRLDNDVDNYIKHIKISNKNSSFLDKLLSKKKCCDNQKKRITQCKTILPLLLDIHIMDNFSLNIDNTKIENDIKSHQVRDTLIPYLNKIWSQTCVRWELRNIYVENVDDNLVNEFPKDFDRKQKHKALAYMLKNLDMSKKENKIMLRNELFRMSNESYFNKNKFNIYIFPYLGKNITGLTIDLKQHGIVGIVGLWNNYKELKYKDEEEKRINKKIEIKENVKHDKFSDGCGCTSCSVPKNVNLESFVNYNCSKKSIFKMTKFQLAYLISKHLGYSLGLEETDNVVNIMSKKIIDLSSYIYDKQCSYSKNPNPYLSTHITSQIPKNMVDKCTPVITSSLKHKLLLKNMHNQDLSNSKLLLFTNKQIRHIIKNILNETKIINSKSSDIIQYSLSEKCKTVFADCKLFDRIKINNINEKNKCIHTIYKIVEGKPLEEEILTEEEYGIAEKIDQTYNPDKCIFPILSDLGKFICKTPKEYYKPTKVCRKEEPKTYLDKIDFSHY